TALRGSVARAIAGSHLASSATTLAPACDERFTPRSVTRGLPVSIGNSASSASGCQFHERGCACFPPAPFSNCSTKRTERSKMQRNLRTGWLAIMLAAPAATACSGSDDYVVDNPSDVLTHGDMMVGIARRLGEKGDSALSQTKADFGFDN